MLSTLKNILAVSVTEVSTVSVPQLYKMGVIIPPPLSGILRFTVVQDSPKYSKDLH